MPIMQKSGGRPLFGIVSEVGTYNFYSSIFEVSPQGLGLSNRVEILQLFNPDYEKLCTFSFLLKTSSTGVPASLHVIFQVLDHIFLVRDDCLDNIPNGNHSR